MGSTKWPEGRARRLEVRMAARTDSARSPEHRLDRDTLATLLVGRREQLLQRLPRQVKLARRLTADQREWVIDEAIDFLVTENDRVIADEDALERAFWAVANLRVRRVREGRYDTVRAGYGRVDVDEVEIANGDATPEDHAVRSFERELLEEFAAELTDEERDVLALKYAGPKELGRFGIARALGRRPHEIRRNERAIARKLNAFSAVVVAGTLCEQRHSSLEALAHGRASALDERVAHLHVERCTPCRAEFKSLVRAIKTGQLPREIAQILPAPTIEVTNRRHGPWEIAVDWLTRPFGHDATMTASQLAPVGRGIGTVAAVKIGTACIAGICSVGACVATGILPLEPPPSEPPPRATPVARHTATPSPTPSPSAPTRTAVVTTPTPKPKQRKPRRESSRSSETSHERARTISPPVTAPGGGAVSEFEPGPVTSAPPQPAPAPADAGPEFP